MKSKRNCEQCKTPYQPTRSDQKFCDATCRWNFWRKKEDGKNKEESKQDKTLAGISKPEQKEEPEEKNLLASLRNVPVSGKPQTETKQEQTEVTTQIKTEPEKTVESKPAEQKLSIETKEYREAKEKRDKIAEYHQKALQLLETCNKRVEETQQALAQIPKVLTKNNFRKWGVDAEDLFGDEIEELAFERDLKQNKLQENLRTTVEARTKINAEISKAAAALKEAEQRLKSIKQYEEPKPKLSEILYGIISKKQPEEKKVVKKSEPIPETKTDLNLNEKETANALHVDNTFAEEPDISNPKIASSVQIRNMSFGSFPFKGNWRDFLGEPQLKFHLGIHGKPGWGKSTLCVQFADYLAKNFGEVMYISGEEGFSKTVRDKLVNNGINNPHLYFANIRSYEEIKTEIGNAYHFIFIDSLDVLKINVEMLRDLKAWYPQSSFITVSQSTKDGKMRGTNDLMHENDITVAVNKPGIATTTKNRFGKIGLEFNIFDTMEATQQKTEKKTTVPKPIKFNERPDKLL
ncbi:MAG: hypothetical protein H0W61_08555 [Bacteroidetes bacterium]|nr:hypothetical protein [Bacteroidota bacterium]